MPGGKVAGGMVAPMSGAAADVTGAKIGAVPGAAAAGAAVAAAAPAPSTVGRSRFGFAQGAGEAAPAPIEQQAPSASSLAASQWQAQMQSLFPGLSLSFSSSIPMSGAGGAYPAAPSEPTWESMFQGGSSGFDSPAMNGQTPSVMYPSTMDDLGLGFQDPAILSSSLPLSGAGAGVAPGLVPTAMPMPTPLSVPLSATVPLVSPALGPAAAPQETGRAPPGLERSRQQRRPPPGLTTAQQQGQPPGARPTVRQPQSCFKSLLSSALFVVYVVCLNCSLASAPLFYDLRHLMTGSNVFGQKGFQQQ